MLDLATQLAPMLKEEHRPKLLILDEVVTFQACCLQKDIGTHAIYFLLAEAKGGKVCVMGFDYEAVATSLEEVAARIDRLLDEAALATAPRKGAFIRTAGEDPTMVNVFMIMRTTRAPQRSGVKRTRSMRETSG